MWPWRGLFKGTKFVVTGSRVSLDLRGRLGGGTLKELGASGERRVKSKMCDRFSGLVFHLRENLIAEDCLLRGIGPTLFVDSGKGKWEW